ncbi:transposase [Halarcobacter anaerophilus]|uniref:transposase n=1 Tax=Halarcobacter anaerophilus TaxID=877500 RepID=UPI000E5D4D86
MDVSIPRDRDGTFEPQLVKKRERLLKSKPLEPIYPIIFMDATVLKIRVDYNAWNYY